MNTFCLETSRQSTPNLSAATLMEQLAAIPTVSLPRISEFDTDNVRRNLNTIRKLTADGFTIDNPMRSEIEAQAEEVEQLADRMDEDSSKWLPIAVASAYRDLLKLTVDVSIRSEFRLD